MRLGCVLVGLFLIFISGCDGTLKEPTPLTFRITWEAFSGRGEAIQSVIAAFNESQKDVIVTMVGGNEVKEDYLQTLYDKEADVCVIPYRLIKDNDIASHLYDLTEYYADRLSAHYDTIAPLSMNNNTLIGVPWIGHSMALVYNKNLVHASDVDVSQIQSLDDLVLACAYVEANTDASGIGLVGANHHDITWMVNQFIYTYGGELVDGEQLAINTPSSREALDFYKNTLGTYAQEGWQDDSGVEVMEAFAKEEVCFEIQGPWAVTDIWKRGNPFDIGVIPLKQLGVYSEVGPMMLAVNKDVEDIEAATQFIDFMLSDEAQELLLKGEYIPKYDAYYPFRVPIKLNSDLSPFLKQYPEFTPFIEGFTMPSISTPSVKWAEVEDDYKEILHKIMIEEVSIEDGLEAIGQ